MWGAVVVAAGRGTRFGRPKQLVNLAGEPMVFWCLQTIGRMAEVSDIIVATEAEWREAIAAVAARAAGRKCTAVVEGGATRQESVYRGLRALPSRCRAALIHDGARPLVRENDIKDGMRVVKPGIGGVLAAPLHDTIKEVDPHSKVVRRTLDRNLLWAAQTPQLGMLEDVLRAHEEARRTGVSATDDATLLEGMGIQVRIVPSSAENFKVTVPEDLKKAEETMRARMEHLEVG